MAGYLVYSVVDDSYESGKEFKDYDYCNDGIFEYFSYKQVEVGEENDCYIAVDVVKVESIDDIACSMFEHGYDGEFIECFLQNDVPYGFR